MARDVSSLANRFAITALFSLSSILPVQVLANSIGVSVGVHGIAIDYTWQLNKNIDVRFALTDMPFSDELEADGITYELEYERTNLAVLVDLMPWENGFHLTAGLFALEHQWLIDAKLNGDYYIGDGQWQANDLKLHGEITYAAASPYLGLGWKNIFGENNHWAMTVEAGVMYVGSAAVDYGATGEVCDVGGANCIDSALGPVFQKNLAEEEQQLEEKLEDYEFWPVIQLGLNYKF